MSSVQTQPPMPKTQVTQLDPLTFPLFGSRLIEASAGTGKTFTLALLYVRLILGQGLNGCGFQRPLTPKEILVVTFTELAAGELRDRIRARLVEVADYFKDPTQADDGLLVTLRQDYPADEWPRCAWRLQMAAESMDEASVSTIHSWCNRMLVEHTFDTRGLFSRELVTDTRDLLSEVVQDYWRVHFYRLSTAEASKVLGAFASPGELEAALRDVIKPTSEGISFIGQPLVAAPNMLTEGLAEWAAYQAQVDKKRAEVRTEWADNWQEIKDHLLALQPGLNKTSFPADKFPLLLDEIAAWLNGEGPEPDKLRRFAAGSFKINKTAAIKTELPLKAFALVKELNDLTAEDQQPALPIYAAVLAEAALWVKTEFQKRMQQHAQMGFDDLLVQLAQALDPDHAFEHAQSLAATLRRNFPIAMIDEFQDTDPIQFSIFDRIYRVAENSPEQGIFMIGDPKQSIYSFRGADIHTYLAVRNATQDRHYTLKKNFRSTQGVVDACNAFFAYAEQQPEAAFRYQAPESPDNPIPFIAVDAQGRDEQLYLHNQAVDPMTLWYFAGNEPAKPLSMGAFREQAAAVAASQISEWLTAASAGLAGFGKNDVEQALQPADIAILVRTSKEAGLMADTLSARGVPSVFLSDREALLASPEAADLLHWLRACAEPSDERLVKAALGTCTLGLALTQLAKWQENELAWEAEMQQFSRLHFIWRKQGILVMLQRLMAHYQLPARLLAQAKGERSLTNLLHLGEWLQQSASHIDGEQALIRHLHQHLGQDDQQHLLRLESDARRVKIITIHKSKGLEFPLVLLPFISGWRDINGRQKQVSYQLDAGTYTEVAGDKVFPPAWHAANEERIKEDLRLLYVAITRASHALWLGIAPLASGRANKPQLEKSALGYVLNGGKVFKDAGDVWQAAEALAQHPCITLVSAPEANDVQAPKLAETALEAARPAPQLGNLSNWWIASYSALQFGNQAQFGGSDTRHSPQPNEPTSAQEDQLLELSKTQLEEASTASLATYSPQERAVTLLPASNDVMHLFPRGPKWGTFLHGLLEWAAVARGSTPETRHLRGFMAAAQDEAGRNAMLASRCKLRNIEHLVEPLSLWLTDFIQQPWQTTGFALTDLTPANIAVELEFLIEVHQVRALDLDGLVRPYTLQDTPAPQAKNNVLNGMLKGFIDLVAEKDGRYYVIDWKSNYLGASDADYSQASMQAAINEHRYDLQYVLYILALHRQLTARLPGYDYDLHVGGALYVFLRGWQAETQGLFHHKPPKALIEALDTLFSHAIEGVSL
ncbi:exodeoxyribonuclease V subunit beta [Oceanisphaera sp. W20_SRM_FM3]|uniref:exodeoxyribonuclease V subunit beta n=1 Tax=Oceanisphaera sp. W20_SRM_FM3 TaxID=3240267 RepID=UPI003F9923A4